MRKKPAVQFLLEKFNTYFCCTVQKLRPKQILKRRRFYVLSSDVNDSLNVNDVIRDSVPQNCLETIFLLNSRY